MTVSGKVKKRLAVLAGIISVALVASIAAQAAISRSAPINKFDGVDEIVEACTNATNFVNIAKMKETFTVGGSANVSVLAMFQGSLSLDSSDPSDTGFIRLTIDGAQQSPGEVPTIAPGDRGTHGFNWQSAPLAPGSHTAKVQWRTDLGNTFCADARSLIIVHK